MTVLGEEDGEVTCSDGHLLWLKGGGVKGEVTFFAVGFRFGKFLYGETSYAFLSFQGVLYVDVLSVCFVAVLVLRLGLVLGDDGFDAWIKLIDAILYVRLGIAKEFQSDTNVFGNGGVCFEVVYVVVNHGVFNVNLNDNENDDEFRALKARLYSKRVKERKRKLLIPYRVSEAYLRTNRGLNPNARHTRTRSMVEQTLFREVPLALLGLALPTSLPTR